MNIGKLAINRYLQQLYSYSHTTKHLCAIMSLSIIQGRWCNWCCAWHILPLRCNNFGNVMSELLVYTVRVTNL